MVFIREWSSFKEIIDNNPQYWKDHISRCCVGRKKTAYGFIWKYKHFVYDQNGFVSIKTDNGRKYSNYKINKNGVVINNIGRPLKNKRIEYYHVVLVSDSGKRNTLSIHRLVALTFIPNPNKYKNVNHIDENKFNNHVNNLEWCTSKHNTRHSLGKKVQQIDINTGEVINKYNSIVEAFESLNRKKGNPWGIGRVCNGTQETSYGYKWKFVET